MLNFTKIVSCLVIRTAHQIDTKLMHLCESLGDNVLVKSYLIKGFNFLRHELKQKSLHVYLYTQPGTIRVSFAFLIFSQQ